MARFTNPGKLERKEWEAWVASQPPAVREIADRIDPWTLYRMRSTGQRAVFRGLRPVDYDYFVAVEVWAKFNLVLAGSDRVVVTTLDDLVPCQLPGPGDRVGMLDVQPRLDGWVMQH